MFSSELAVDLIARATGAAIAISSLELLALSEDTVYRQLTSWKWSKSLDGWSTNLGETLGFDAIMTHQAFSSIVLLRSIIGLGLLIFGSHNAFFPTELALATAGGMVVVIRSPYGLEGSDQLTLIVSIALLVGSIFSSNALALAFIAGQLMLAYVTAGAVKLVSRHWRSGVALVGVMGTSMYGHAGTARLLVRFRRLPAAISWSIIGFEIAFPAILFVPWYVAIGFLIVGMTFHLTNAIVMGLNCFAVIFIGSYPAIWWLRIEVNSLGFVL